MSDLLSGEAPVKGWKPNLPGDSVVGQVERIAEQKRGGKNEAQTVAYLSTPSGLIRRVWIMHAVLKSKWTEQAPTRGDRVAIIYDGEEKAEEGYTYSRFFLEVERDTP